MGSSWIRLRISLIVAIALVIANMVLVITGSPNGYYAGLSKVLVPDAPLAATSAAQAGSPDTAKRYPFAALEARAQHSLDVF